MVSREFRIRPGRERVCAAFRKRVFTEGDHLFVDMLSRIASARESICLEAPVFRDDAIGRRFAEALAERAEQGIRIRLLVDALASLGTLSPRLVAEMQTTGVRVRHAHRWQWRAPGHWHARDQRRLLVVDGNSLHLGGLDIEQGCSRAMTGQRCRTGIHLRLDGALARAAEKSFDAFWYCRLRRHVPQQLPVHDTLVSNHDMASRKRLTMIVSAMCEAGRRRLWLRIPGPIPGAVERTLLGQAAKRGLDVRVFRGVAATRIRWHSLIGGDRALRRLGVTLSPAAEGPVDPWCLLLDEWSIVSTGHGLLDQGGPYVSGLISADIALNRKLASLFLQEDTSRDHAST